MYSHNGPVSGQTVTDVIGELLTATRQVAPAAKSAPNDCLVRQLYL